MTKLLGKSLLLFLLTAVPFALYIRENPNLFTVGSEGMLRAQKEWLEGYRNEERIDFVAIGDSTVAAAIQPGLQRFRCLATPAATSIESYFQLKRFLDRGAKPFSITFGTYNHRDRYRSLFWELYVHLGFYESSDLDRIAADAREVNDWPMLDGARGTRAALEFAWRRHAFSVGFFPYFVNELQAQVWRWRNRRWTNTLIYRQVINRQGLLVLPDREDRAPGEPVNNLGVAMGLGRGELFGEDASLPSPLLDLYTRKCFELAEDNGIFLFVTLPPVYAPALNGDARRRRTAYVEHMRRLTRDFKMVRFLEIPFDETDAGLFWDTLHLSKQGAKRYSAALLEVTTQTLGR